MTIEWKNPPPGGHGRVADAYKEVRKHPGEWALVSRGTTGSTQWYLRRKLDPEPEKWTIRIARTEDGKLEVYLRYE